MNPHVEFVATSDWSIVASEPWIMIRGGFREKQRPPPPAISREINVPNLDKKVCMSNTHNTALGPPSLLFLSKAICNIMHSRVRDIVFLLNFTRAHTLKNRHWNRSIISFSSYILPITLYINFFILWLLGVLLFLSCPKMPLILEIIKEGFLFIFSHHSESMFPFRPVMFGNVTNTRSKEIS